MTSVFIAAEVDLERQTVAALHVYDPATQNKVRIELPATTADQLAAMFCRLVAFAASPDHDEDLRCLYLERKP